MTATGLLNVEDGTGRSLPEYMEDFNEAAKAWAKQPLKEMPDVGVRKQQVSDWIEEHYSATGRMPSNYALSRLADYMLAGELKDTSPDKLTNTEFPFLSNNQLRRRLMSQVSMEVETMDFLRSKIHRRMDTLSRTPVKKADY